MARCRPWEVRVTLYCLICVFDLCVGIVWDVLCE